jgi:hypothetical protein
VLGEYGVVAVAIAGEHGVGAFVAHVSEGDEGIAPEPPRIAFGA